MGRRLFINNMFKSKCKVYNRSTNKAFVSRRRYFETTKQKVLHYRLYRFRMTDKTCFLVEVRGLGSRAKCSLGSSPTWASDAYRIIVRNGVTPCTLRDVVEDLGFAQVLPTSLEAARI